jgi:putative nucleotidyltransferase with HDIG domain
MGAVAQEGLGQRWPRRRNLARLVSALAYAIPIGAAVGASLALSRILPAPGGVRVEAGDWAVLVVLSTAVLFSVDRLSRRLLPLAALLELSLLFPDRAPQRMAVALRAGGIRNLQARIEHAKRNGVADEPARAAARIVELVGALHAHDRRTRGHSERVRALTEALATELKVGPEDLDRLRWSALLHDIGKIHVSPRILNKPGHLHADEWDAIRLHPEEGARLAAPLEPWLGEWAQVIVQHHERWDGSGYPYGLREREISYGARIVALADAYEVMTAARSYKMPMSVAAARRELTVHAGTQFDPQIVRAFLELSIGRLRWIAGPVSWAAQVPFLGWLRHAVFPLPIAGGALGQTMGRAAGVVGTAASAVGTAVVVGALGVPAPAPPAEAATISPPSAAASGVPSSLVPVVAAPPPVPAGSPSRVQGSPPAPAPATSDPSGIDPAEAPGAPPPTSPGPPPATAAGNDAAPAAAGATTAAPGQTTAAPAPTTAAPAPTTAAPAPTASSQAAPAFTPPRRRRTGWVGKDLGSFTQMQGGLGHLKGVTGRP